MSEPANKAWRMLSAADRARLRDRGQRLPPLVFGITLAIPLVGFLILLATGNLLLAFPFLLVGFLGSFAPFVAAIGAALLFHRNFLASRGVDLSAIASKTDASREDSGHPDNPGMAAILAEIETERVVLARGFERGERWVKRIAVVAAPCLFAFALWSVGAQMVVPAIIICAGLYGIAHFAATSHYQTRFTTLFKQRALPQMLARHGLAAIGSDTPIPLDRPVFFGLIAPETRTRRDDAFRCDHRGAVVTIAEFVPAHDDRKNDGNWRPRKLRIPTNGLLLQISYPGRVPATTLIGRQLPRPEALAPVRLEDPEFEEIFEVWGSDQIGSRTLLTPAVMRRLLQMADSTDLLPPSVLVEGGTMTVVFEKTTARDMFEPGKVTDPELMHHLRKIADDLDAVMGLADDLLDMVERTPGVRLGPMLRMPTSLESRE